MPSPSHGNQVGSHGPRSLLVYGSALVIAALGVAVGAVLQLKSGYFGDPKPHTEPSSETAHDAPANWREEQARLKKNIADLETKLAQFTGQPGKVHETAQTKDADGPHIAPATPALVLPDPGPDPTSAAEFAARAEQRLATNDFDGAVADASEAMRRDQSKVQTWSGIAYRALAARGAKLAGEKRYREAVSDLTTALAHAGTPQLRAAVLCQRAKAQAGDRATDAALADFAEAIKLDPQGICGYLGRADLYRFLERTQEAIEDYDACLRINPKHADALVARGRSKLTLAQLDEAVGDFESAVAQGYALDDAAARQLAGALAQRGDANTQSGKLDLAIADFEKARRLAPEHEELWGARAATAYLRQGEALARLGRADEALAAYDRAVALKGRLHYAALNNRGAYNIRLKRYDNAITDLTSAIEVDGDRALAFYNRHVAYYRAGQADKAQADLARARQLDSRISPPAPAK